MYMILCSLAVVAAVVTAVPISDCQVNWDVKQLHDWLVGHPGDRDRCLNLYTNRAAYFNTYNDDEATVYYNAHPEHRNEWHHTDPVAAVVATGDCQTNWDVKQLHDWLVGHSSDRDRCLNLYGNRASYFDTYNDEATVYYNAHPEHRNEWHHTDPVAVVVATDDCQVNWEVKRLHDWLVGHPGDRDRCLNLYGNRAAYFDTYNDDAKVYYNAHPEHRSEWHHADSVAAVGPSADTYQANWDMNKRVEWIKNQPQAERERLLNMDPSVRVNYFNEHPEQAGTYYDKHTDQRTEWHH